MRLDFVKRIGGLGERALGVMLAGIVVAALNSADGNAATTRLRAANRVASPVSATLAAQKQASICLQDESNGNFLTFDGSGAYSFTSCATGFTLSGTGVVRVKGQVVTLEDVKTDRRVTATVDMALRQGKAAAQTFAPSRSFTIRDKNIDNNTCSCGGGPKT